jgi:metal-sulfur cluster biosynthetic enzyme
MYEKVVLRYARIDLMPQVTEEDVLSALKSCYDPEIPVNIVDMGLIYKVNLAPAPAENPEQERQDVTVDMTLTSQGCPEHVNISAQVKSRLEQLPGIRNAGVNVVWTPPWTPERLSPDAKKQLGIE